MLKLRINDCKKRKNQIIEKYFNIKQAYGPHKTMRPVSIAGAGKAPAALSVKIKRLMC